MDIRGLLVLVLIIIILYVLIKYIMGDNKPHTAITSGKVPITIPWQKLASPADAAKQNFAHCIWFNIDNWNYNNGLVKPLLVRTTSMGGPGIGYEKFTVTEPCPAIVFGETNNNCEIWCKLMDTGGSISTNTEMVNNIKYNKCTLTNIPIQKWCFLVVSYYGTTCDVYMDGKLIRTCVMDAPAHITKTADVYITPGLKDSKGSFDGWTSDYRYYSEALNPQQVYNLYKKGFGGNWITNMMNTNVSVVISKNGKITKEYKF